MTTTSKLVPIALLNDIEMTWREASAFSNTANNLIERGLPELRALLAAAAIEQQGPVEVLGYRYDNAAMPNLSPICRASSVDEAGREDWTETELVDRVHVTRLHAELAALREELAGYKHDIGSFLETTAKVCNLLGIDTEDAKNADGKPSDVLFSHAEALRQRLTAAEQRNAELTQALERGKLWLELFRAWFGDYGVSQEDHMAIIRTLKGLPHPPSEFDKPIESGASE